jgi:hypothetical protein
MSFFRKEGLLAAPEPSAKLGILPQRKTARGRVKSRAFAKTAKPTAKKTVTKKPTPKKLRAPVVANRRKRSVRRALPHAPRRTLGASPYDTGLDRNAANYQPMTPLSHLARAAST